MYQDNEYLRRNDLDLSEAGGAHIRWKVDAILPLLDRFMIESKKTEVTVLDVGGGVGHALKLTADYLQNAHRTKVIKYACDLTPGFVEMQKERNHDLSKALNEDIRRTSLADKEVDLALMIDVLEHVPDYEAALHELRRIARHVIFRVPLEGNLMLRLFNALTMNRQRKWAIETLGHVNVFHALGLKRQVRALTGSIQHAQFVNTFAYYRRSGYYHNKSIAKKLMNDIACLTFKVSPLICSYVFFDSIVFLVKCHDVYAK